MSSSNQEYSVNQEITTFFERSSATRSACDERPKELVGGSVTPVAVQGVCSYSVYAGPSDSFVVQFRLKSLLLKTETSRLARTIFGSLAPQVSFEGQIGEDIDGRESLYIYVMSRVHGISHLDFILARDLPDNSPEYFAWRKTLVADVARFFALAWKNPRDVDRAYRESLRHRLDTELQLLLVSLPDRFHPVITKSLDSIPAVFSLPMVLLHKDFGTCNIMVDSTSCHLVGVIDWAEAEIGPFGLNLHSIQPLMSMFHLKKGYIRYDDYDLLEETLWQTFSKEIGGLGDEEARAIKSARVIGLLLSLGFTSPLANMPKPEPIRDDKTGAYNMLHLDGLLVTPATRFAELTSD